MEIWDLYTKERVKTDKTMIRGEAHPRGYYRIVVHICIFNSEGKMLIQQRQPFKKGWSGFWDLTAGGSAISGDTSQSAAERELREELGIDFSFKELCPAITVNFQEGFDDIYLLDSDIDLSNLKLQFEEVQAVKWATAEEIIQMIKDKFFIPYNEDLIRLLFFLRKHKSLHTECDFTQTK
ncbi:MAG: NUDIX domain-containing protein [Clostridiales bacterium]|nr:NUDIX domain-containing protein [Clostridiales bacterium]